MGTSINFLELLLVCLETNNYYKVLKNRDFDRLHNGIIIFPEFSKILKIFKILV